MIVRIIVGCFVSRGGRAEVAWVLQFVDASSNSRQDSNDSMGRWVSWSWTTARGVEPHIPKRPALAHDGFGKRAPRDTWHRVGVKKGEKWEMI